MKNKYQDPKDYNRIANLSLGKGGIIEKEEINVPQAPITLSTVNVKPKSHMVILQPVPAQEYITKSGIIIPDEILAKSYKDNAPKGIVVRVGEGVTEYKRGELVIVGRPEAGIQVMLNDVMYLFVYASEIVGTYDDVVIGEAEACKECSSSPCTCEKSGE